MHEGLYWKLLGPLNSESPINFTWKCLVTINLSKTKRYSLLCKPFIFLYRKYYSKSKSIQSAITLRNIIIQEK